MSLDDSQLDLLLHTLLQAKSKYQEAIDRQKAEYIGKQTDQFLDDLTDLSPIQQLGHVTRHVAVPLFKRWLNLEKENTNEKDKIMPTKNCKNNRTVTDKQ